MNICLLLHQTAKNYTKNKANLNFKYENITYFLNFWFIKYKKDTFFMYCQTKHTHIKLGKTF